MFELRSTLSYAVLIMFILVLLVAFFAAIKMRLAMFGVGGLNGENAKFTPIRKLFTKLNKGGHISDKTIYNNSKDLEGRILTYELLSKFSKQDLFPEEFLTLAMASESYLGHWLNTHIQFDSFPDEIQFVKNIEIQQNGIALVYQFKNFSDSKWYFGFVIYANSNREPYSIPNLIDCNFKLKNTSLEKHREIILNDKNNFDFLYTEN